MKANRRVGKILKKAKESLKNEIIGLFLVSIGMLTIIGLVNPSIGVVGNLIEIFLRGAVGEARFIIPLCLIILGTRLVIKPLRTKTPVKMHGFFLLVAVLLAFWHLQLVAGNYIQAGLNGDGGGLIGAIMVFFMTKSFGIIGSYIILSNLFLASLLLMTNTSLIDLTKNCWRKCKEIIKKIKQVFINFLYEDISDTEAGERVEQERDKTLSKENPIQSGIKTEDEYVGESPWDKVTNSLEMGPALNLDFVCEHEEQLEEHKTSENSSPANEHSRTSSIELPLTDTLSSYRLPPFDILKQPIKNKNSKINKDISQNVQVLEKTLSSFGVKARVAMVARGPAITRYEIQPPSGIKVSRIVNLADDIALSMAAPDVRIEAPIPGKAAVGIEVPNKEISRVFLRELLETREFQQSSSRLTVALGKDIAGNPIVADLSKMPHLLIAGATGSGKSVCMNTLIASILFKSSPEEVKFLIIDPKMVELTTYNGIPHLVSPIVTAPKKAATVLRWAVKEMEHRYKLFAEVGVKDISRYNKNIHSSGDQKEQKVLPLLVILIDELSDLMMVAPADVEDAICRLAQMARAAGIHLVVATQRPSVDVITGLIKANIPSRISFAVSSQTDSRTILDMGGAEKLLGRGDMLFFPIGASKPLRVQGAYLSDMEVENLVTYLNRQSVPVYEQEVVEKVAGNGNEQEYEDDLLPRAVMIFIESGQASISMLQRRLRIGYTRAARLIDIMEQKGIVGQFEGSKPRAVLINEDEYRQMFSCQ